jgi:hypothetical protein
MSFQLQFTGAPAAAKTALAAVQAPPGNTVEAACLARMITAMQAEVDNMNAANAVAVYFNGSHTEKSFQIECNIDKATPVLGSQLVALSNASPAN